MAPRTLTFPFAWLVVSTVCMNAAYTSAWGTYVCDIQDKGLQKIREVCSGAAIDVKSPLSVLEEKIERVLEFVEEIKTAEDSWLHLTKKSGTVERDLSQHEETDRRDQSDRDRSSKETKDDKDTRKDDQTRVEEDRRNRGRDRSYGGRDWRDRETDTYDRRDRERDTYDRRDRDRDYDRRDRDRDYDRRDRETDTYDRRDREQDSYDRRDREWRSRRERTSDDDREEERRQRTEEREVDREKTGEKEEAPARGEDDTRIDVRRKPHDSENEPKKGECKAIVIDNHETIGMFYMMSYQHGHCANRNPIVEPIRYCLGYCTTKTFIDREAGIWSQGSDCKSCQPMQFETIKIPLTCDDGFSFDKKFENVVDCKCQPCQSALEG